MNLSPGALWNILLVTRCTEVSVVRAKNWNVLFIFNSNIKFVLRALFIQVIVLSASNIFIYLFIYFALNWIDSMLDRTIELRIKILFYNRSI